MGKPTKVGQRDPQFQNFLRKKFGNSNANKILSNPANMKRAYSMYLKGDHEAIDPNDIPF